MLDKSLQSKPLTCYALVWIRPKGSTFSISSWMNWKFARSHLKWSTLDSPRHANSIALVCQGSPLANTVITKACLTLISEWSWPVLKCSVVMQWLYFHTDRAWSSTDLRPTGYECQRTVWAFLYLSTLWLWCPFSIFWKMCAMFRQRKWNTNLGSLKLKSSAALSVCFNYKLPLQKQVRYS